MITSTRTCPRCRFPILRRGDDYTSCVSCGWEDYGRPVNPDSEPVEVPCPGAGRLINAVDPTQKWGACPACGRRLKPSTMGFTPKHPVMSDTRCNGSEHGIVRVVYRFGSNQIQARGCAGCALPVSDQRATTMHRHFVRDSPKMKTYLNSLL